MKHVLEPLACTVGVRTAALVTLDGVPICVHSARSKSEQGQETNEEVEALTALATAWLGEIKRAVAPLSWDAPRRLVLQALRGTLIILEAPGALLLAVVDTAVQAEELRLPMDVAVQRMQRHMRSLDRKAQHASAPVVDQTPGIFPHRTGFSPVGTSSSPEASSLQRSESGGSKIPL